MKTIKRSAPRKPTPSNKKKPVERRKPIGAAKPDRARQPDRSAAPSPIGHPASPDRSAQVQAALYAIASAASSVQDMPEFYAAMHRIVGELMYAKNFFIALYDEPSGLLSFPYFVDEKDAAPPTQPLANFRGVTGYVIRTGESVDDHIGNRLIASGIIDQVGTFSTTGIAVPLKVESKTIGVVFIQSYTPGIGYQVEDVKILEFVAQHIATALTRARAIEETRQRNAELAIINSVQEGLASQLNFQAIVDLVGDKIRETFSADVVGIGLYDSDRKLTSFPYVVDHGERYFPQPAPSSGKLMSYLQTQGAILIHTHEDAQRLMADKDASNIGGPTLDNSYLIVPLLIGDQFMGNITVAKLPAHAFAESDVRLLQTLANSMIVALENVRSFEAEKQRAAELAIINSVQEGLASKLDMQAIYDLVGDKIQEIFDAQVAIISILDRASNQSTAYYAIERGVRLPNFTLPIRERIVQYLDETHQPLVINTNADQQSREYGIEIIPGTESPKALVLAPLIVGNEVKGAISLQNLDRENVFSESDIRLLQTLANSMSVALENARLFDEVQTRNREITEALEQQTATSEILRVIAESPTNIQPVMDVIAEHAYRLCNGLFASVYRTDGQLIYEVATRNFTPEGLQQSRSAYPRPLANDSSVSSRAILGRTTLNLPDVLNDLSLPELTRQYARANDFNSLLVVPLMRGDEAIGSIGVGRRETGLFTDKLVAILQTFAQQAVIAIENVRLFNELQARNREITEALEQQTATSDILRVMAGSPTDIQPVLNVVAEYGARLSESIECAIFEVDGEDKMKLTAHAGADETVPIGTRFPLNRQSIAGAAILDRAIYHVPDIDETGDQFPLSKSFQKKYRAFLGVPLLREGRATGVIFARRAEARPFTEKQIQLIKTFADQAIIAIENVRLFTETQRLLRETDQRAAELAIINSVQQGLASKLDMQSIYDLVGDKIREIFSADVVAIALYDRAHDLLSYPYVVDHGERYFPEATGPSNFWVQMLQLREPLLLHTFEELEQLLAESGTTLEKENMAGPTHDNSFILVPLLLGAETTGFINIGKQLEHAFSESDVRLLMTLASSMSVALENARLFDETQRLLKETDQRAAELSIINSVQAGLASKLDMQSIYDLVGDKIRDIFDSRVMIICTLDHAAEMTIFNYAIEKGERYYPAPMPFNGLVRHLIRTRQTLLINEDLEERAREYGAQPVPGTEMGKSVLYVPLMVGDTVRGRIALYNYDRENAFTDSDVRLLETLASSMSVALENARLFDETNRLLKETDQRAAELAIINSVQQGLASKLDMQSIYDLVGDKIRDLFDAQSILMAIFDLVHRQRHVPYMWEKGQRLRNDQPAPFNQLAEHLIATKQTIVINEDAEIAAAALGMSITPGTETMRSGVFVPLVASDAVRGFISLQNVDRENAFSESDIRLLQTLANSMSVALENARLFDETQRLLKETDQRAAELSIINSVQQGLASKLDMQSIYDLVGDKINEIFDVQGVAIMHYDHTARLTSNPYLLERGQRFYPAPSPFTAFAENMIRTKQVVLVNHNAERRMAELGLVVIPGTEQAKSSVFVPLIVADQVNGVITLENIDHENAFTESDVRLLNTLASSMSVALENARLFDETQRLLKETDQRAAELALINSVQEGLASKLDVQSVYDLVGDKIRDIFDAQVVQIMAYDREANRCQWRYLIEKGERQYVDPTEPRGFSSYMLKSAQPLMLNEGLSEWWEENLKTPVTVLAGDRIKSYLGVPLIIGNEVRGVISLQNVDREHAFAESDLRLLLTLASSMSVALENARLFDAERQRAQELEIINSVGEALASQLDMQAVYDLVGDKIRSIFDAQSVVIATYDRETSTQHFPYMIERGQRLLQDPIPMGPGFGAHIMQTRQPLMINQGIERRATEFGSHVIGGGEMPKSYLGVPLIIGGEAKGVISLQNVDRENAFSETDLRLLTTLSSSMGVALENARLFAETNRRASEMSALTDIGREISSTLDLEAVIDRIALRAHEVLKVGTSAVYLLEPDGITLRPIAAIGDYSAEVLTSRSRMGEGIIGSVAQSGVAKSIADAVQDPRTVHLAGTPQEESGEKMMVAPLFARDQVIGAMTVWRDPQGKMFVPDDLNFLVGLSRQAAIAIQNARLFEESQKRANETAALNEIGREISATLDINTVLERITTSARDLLIGDTSAVYLVEPDGETLNAVVAIGDIADQIKASAPKLGTGIVGNIAQTGLPEFINNTALDRRAVHIAGTSNDDEGKKIMVAPLPAKDRILGVMAVWRDVDRPLFTQTDLDFLTGLARQAVIAIDNARLFDEVQQQKQYSESLVQYSPVAIVTMDLNNVVVSWNPGAEKLFGYKPNEAIGRNLDELITTEEQRVEAKKYSQQTMLGDRIHAITRRLRKDGSFVDVDLSSVPVKMSASGQRSYVAIYHDITELQRAKQEAESANLAKSAFLATMSHEIRTPMNAIIGMSGLILDTPLNAEQREFAEIIRNSGDALLTIINDILDFSKIEAGKMEMESQPFDLRECLEGTLDLIATRAFDKGLDLAYVIDEHVPPTILGDITRVRQIVLNLLTNAVKFTEKGEVVLDVKPDGSIGRDGRSITLHFTMRDTGLGIPPDRMSRLFQSFSQVDASTARKYGGTGLGLAISKRLSEMMGGSMWAISDGLPGKGATFHFTIKTQAADAPAASTRRDLRGVQPSMTEKRILIVDDNDTNRRILTLQTQKWGMQPRDTASPREALQWIQRGDPFDVAILDMHIPEMDGIAVAKAIREMESARDGTAVKLPAQHKALPLIIFTSLGRREGGSESIEFAAHLTKPIKPSQLFDALVGIFVEQPTHVRRTETAKTQFDPEMAHKHPLRILLAEDNAVNQKLALRLLQQMGYRADVAGNGLEAIEALERQKYDVILMDVQMPEMDGLDATRAIVARWPKGVRPQIIAMTANAMQGDREMCLEAGMDDYMTKPIRIEELVAALLRSKPTIDQPKLPLSDADKK